VLLIVRMGIADVPCDAIHVKSLPW